MWPSIFSVAEPMSKIAFVLGGGGFKGAYQAGVLLGLDRQGIKPDLIIGTSVGAINAFTYSCIGAEELAKRWGEVTGKGGYLSINWWGLLTLRHGIYTLNGLRRKLERIKSSSPPKIPFYSVVSDLRLGNVDYIHSEDPRMMDGVIGSASMPVHMTAVNGWIDGGIREQVAVQKAIDLGATEIYAIPNNPFRVNPDEVDMPKFLWSILFRATDVLTHDVFMHDFSIKSKEGVVIHYLNPPQMLYETLEADPVKMKWALGLGLEIGSKKLNS